MAFTLYIYIFSFFDLVVNHCFSIKHCMNFLLAKRAVRTDKLFSQKTFTCSKSTIETIEKKKGVKYVQS